MPTFQVVAPCHKDSVLNSAFASNYGDLISNNRIDAWIYGHSHTNIDAEIGGIIQSDGICFPERASYEWV